MNFLYPQILFGLFALSIPIIIHLFDFRRAKKIYFSTNQFLRQAKNTTSSRLKLRYLLILLSRLAFIFFLVMAFAQPFLPGKEQNSQKNEVVIYLDNSYSMSNEIETKLKAFDLGYSYVEQIINLYPNETKFTLITNDFASYSNSPKTKSEASDLLTEIGYSNVWRKLNTIISRIQSSDGTGKDIYIISDFQISTLGNLEKLEIDSVNNYKIIPIIDSNPSNVYVDSVYLSNPFLNSYEDNQLKVVVANRGEKTVENLIIKLFINDLQISSSSLNINKGSSDLLSFDLNTDLKKFNKGRLSFEEFPVSFDNDFYFSLNLTDPISILELYSGEPNTITAKVFGNRSLFSYQVFNFNNVDYNLVNKTDLLILQGLEDIDPSLFSQVKDYLKNGGHLVVIPDEKINTDTYTQLFDGLRLVINEGLEKEELATPYLSNPFYKNIFENQKERFGMPKANNLIFWSRRGENLLEYKNQIPYLSRIDNIFLFASPLDDTYTNLHKHALFVPIMYRIASLSKAVPTRLYYNLNETVIALTLDTVSSNDIFKLITINEEFIPNQRMVDNHLIMELPKYALSPGYYELGKGKLTKSLLSFNHDKQESLLAQLTINQIKTAFSPYENVEILDLEDAESFGVQIKEARLGVPLWKYALVLALLFLLAEILLIRFFKYESSIEISRSY